MEEILANLKEKIKISKLMKLNNVVMLIMAIFSVILGYFWYLALPLAIVTLIDAIMKIKERGETLPKVSMVFSVVGIVHCVMVYISIFLMLYSEYVVFY